MTLWQRKMRLDERLFYLTSGKPHYTRFQSPRQLLLRKTEIIKFNNNEGLKGVEGGRITYQKIRIRFSSANNGF